MSDTILKLIPVNPKYTPDISSQNKILYKLKAIFEKQETKIELYDHVQFIDQGENFESVRCPYCHMDVEINWWQEKMDIANENNFEELSLILPCCNIASNLNELDYILPAGFSRFVVEIWNAVNIKDNVTQHLAELEELIGTRLKIITAQY